MSMSDINHKIRFKLYLIFTIFTFAFGIIYEQFSHGVYSKYMMYAFTIPLLGLIASYLLKRLKRDISKISLDLLDMSIATFTFGSIVKGVLEIYGTSNQYVNLYLYAGIIMAVLSVLSMLKKKN